MAWASELEIDKGLQVGGDELINDEDGEHHGEEHDRQRHGGEPQAVAAFETVGQPVDDHADEEDDEDGCVVGKDVGHLLPVPVAADAFHHLGGGAPGGLVGLGGVEVGAAAEKETGEADEDKGEEGVPHGGEAVLELAFAVATASHEGHEVEQYDGGGRDHEGEVEHAEYGNGEEVVEALHADIDECDGDDAVEGAFLFPPFIDEDAQSVECAPGDEVEGGAVPHAAEEHGVEVVEIGGKLFAVAWSHSIDDGKNDHQCHRRRSDVEVLGHQHHDEEHHRRDDEGARGGVAVAAEGDIEVILEPVAERDVPPFPESGGVGGLVGRVEVEGEVETHEHGHADGDVGIAGEVGIDLQGIDQQGGEILKGGV